MNGHKNKTGEISIEDHIVDAIIKNGDLSTDEKNELLEEEILDAQALKVAMNTQVQDSVIDNNAIISDETPLSVETNNVETESKEDNSDNQEKQKNSVVDSLLEDQEEDPTRLTELSSDTQNVADNISNPSVRVSMPDDPDVVQNIKRETHEVRTKKILTGTDQSQETDNSVKMRMQEVEDNRELRAERIRKAAEKIAQGEQNSDTDANSGSDTNTDVDPIIVNPPQEFVTVDGVELSLAQAAQLNSAVGNIDPTVSVNTGSYSKWLESTVSSFIDKMKGSFNWSSGLIDTRNYSKDFFDNLSLDENGWPTELPTNQEILDNGWFASWYNTEKLDMSEGATVTTNVMWYPDEVVDVSPYSGTFHLTVQGEGTIVIQHLGDKNGNDGFRQVHDIDGPTTIEFDYIPNGQRLSISITDTDPNDNGEYIRDISIVHDDHVELFEAGEIFAPEYVELVEDYDSIRYMMAMDTNVLSEYPTGDWDDRPSADFYTYNTGTNDNDTTGWPLEAVIELANKTGTNPWINVPANASNDYVRGMAKYIAENLDPRLDVRVEYGNENWNDFGAVGNRGYNYVYDKSFEEFGEFLVTKDSDGNYVVESDGLLVNKKTWTDLGFSNFTQFEKAMYETGTLTGEQKIFIGGWYHYTAKRATEVGKMFEEEFATIDSDSGETANLINTLGTYTVWDNASRLLLDADVWKHTDPDNFVEPNSVFESLAPGGYFGGRTGSLGIDLVLHWFNTYGAEYATDMIYADLYGGHYLTQGVDYFEYTPDLFTYPDGTIDALEVQTNVTFTEGMRIDLSEAIFENRIDKSIKQAIQRGDGKDPDVEILYGDDIHNFVRLGTNEHGHTTIEAKYSADSNVPFQTVLEFNSVVNKTVEELIYDGNLVLRTSEKTMLENAEYRFADHHVIADEYGLDIAIYEGGQHFKLAIWGGFKDSTTKSEEFIDFYNSIKKDPRIQDIYDIHYKYLEDLTGQGTQDFFQFTDYATPGEYGSFGTVEYLGQQNNSDETTLVYDFFEDLNQNGTSDGGNVAHLQGITAIGTDADDLMVGTVEEDALVGGRGDDTIITGAGDDRLFGGEGSDVMVAGSGDDVLVISDANDIRVDGGEDIDTVRIDKSFSNVNISDLPLSNIEIIDIVNSDATNLTISVADLVGLNSSNTITVLAQSSDTLVLNGFLRAEHLEADVTQSVFQATSGGETVILKVQHEDASLKSSVILDGVDITSTLTEAPNTDPDEPQGATISYDANDLQLVLSYGQSLSTAFVHQEGISTTSPYADRVLGINADDNVVSLDATTDAPTSGGNNERPYVAAMNRIATNFDLAGETAPILLGDSVGQGGRSIQELLLGSDAEYADAASGVAATNTGDFFFVSYTNSGGNTLYDIYMNDGQQGFVTRTTSLRPDYFDRVENTFNVMADYAQDGDFDLQTDILFSWIQGQSNTKDLVSFDDVNGNNRVDAGEAVHHSVSYSELMGRLVNKLDETADVIFDQDMNIVSVVNQQEGTYTGHEQLDFLSSTDNSYLGALEEVYQRSDAAAIDYTTGALIDGSGDITHLNAVGYNKMGQDIGNTMYDILTGQANENDIITIADIVVSDSEIIIKFDNVKGKLIADYSGYNDLLDDIGVDASTGEGRREAPEYLGFMRDGWINNGADGPVDIIDAQITGDSQITLTLSGTVSKSAEFDIVLDASTPLRDDGVEIRVDNLHGQSQMDNQIIHEFIPTQRATLDADGIITSTTNSNVADNRNDINGDADDNNIIGTNNSDRLYGGDGDDVLIAGIGYDALEGGTGADTFVITDASHVDTILDFSTDDGDVLDISDLLDDYNPLEDVLSDFIQINAVNEDVTEIVINTDNDGNETQGNIYIHHDSDLPELNQLIENGNIIL